MTIRILHLFGTDAALQHWAGTEIKGPTSAERGLRFAFTPRTVVVTFPNETVVIHGRVAERRDDSELFRGQRFDCVMAHDSYYRVAFQRFDAGEALRQVTHMVLR